ncbi:MAG: DUF1365 domain-containing protein [Aestuariivita sp.]|nr:DUF1365 domain-containing protein [Aestuariivita sp.]
MTGEVFHVESQTWHGRKGVVSNQFRYSIDYILLNTEEPVRMPYLFRRNKLGLCSLFDRDYGGQPGHGSGSQWVRKVLQQFRLPQPERIMLLGQPRFWNYVFNPVSFWLCYNSKSELSFVIAEVTNTFGERHSYLCHNSDYKPIATQDILSANKVHYVSPFQKIEGSYSFRFDIRNNRIGIWIDFSDLTAGGVTATLTGRIKPLTNASILRAMMKRPFGSRRVLSLIHWQAFKLWWKGERYRIRPEPQETDVTR